jgi:hypothetical protein
MFEDPIKTKKYLKIALFGKGGTGKTRFALSFPKPCVIDGEHSTDPYQGRYDFKVKHTNRWKGLEEPLNWIRAHPGVFETLIIDPATIFYADLINDLILIAMKKRGQETMDRGLWGIEKRRWFAFCNVLTSLPLHVILNFREADVYVDQLGAHGEEVMKKTGEFKLEADKQTEYLFDLSLRCYTEENKKAKESKFLFQVMKSRYDWMPKYAIHDVTKKRPYAELFAQHVEEMLDAPDSDQPVPDEPFVVADQPEKPTPESVAEKAAEVADEAAEVAGAATDDRGGVERTGEMLEKFAGGGDQDAPLASVEDLKVLMTRCAQMKWPNKVPFKASDGKTLLKALYKIESTKELKKFQYEFLYREFGEVLSGRAVLDRDETGCPFVRRLSGAKIPEVASK